LVLHTEFDRVPFAGTEDCDIFTMNLDVWAPEVQECGYER